MNDSGGLQNLWNNTYEWLSRPELWLHIGSVAVKIFLIYLAAKICIGIFKKTVDRMLRERVKGPVQLSQKRSKTLSSLLNNIAVNVIYFIAILLILAEFNIALGPLLAGAGVVGLAIGFGAQGLVKDVVTGFFIIYEDQFSVGDYIDTAGYSGTVQEIGLRVTKIKDWTGKIHIIPNGSITHVTNHSKENGVAVLDVGVPLKEDISRVEGVVEAVARYVKEKEEAVIGEPVIMGVEELSGSGTVIRLTLECQPMTHWAITRKLRRELKEEFEKLEIEMK
ncbi:mechanosensitive ion channel family protein [Bacillus horti]|uniref:Small conductance mechanosensitive channel n=1 Tax=Caldalkalibacillus horti TaxID=77523 RepID=A0ABT9W223_9BACI|nr:mechanosensitive ion channel family protein [Bacillus horti]MDQ0167119.1 small conductance mechanosensitive channel [Bacillus horti]